MKNFWKWLPLVILLIFPIGYFFFSRALSMDPITTKNASNSYDEQATLGEFHQKIVQVPSFDQRFDFLQPDQRVLGENSSNKRIEVDLTNQRVYAYEGDRMVYNFLISSGLWGRTPTGSFRIWVKFRYTKMSGGSKALGTYYYLPNVPYVMFFYNDQVAKSRGYSLHGTYWHSNFGHPMSHGCINMKTEEAGLLYYWAQPDLQGKQSIYASAENPGTEVIIYGQAPAN